MSQAINDILANDDLQDLYGDWSHEGVIPLPQEDFWVFGYGSLVWNPGFRHLDAQIAKISGYHRKFCVWSQVYRGTPQRPGLVMGLRPGGSCTGRAFKVAAKDAAQVIPYLEKRELRFESYDVKWVSATCRNGQTVRALTFVVGPASPSLAKEDGEEISQGRIVELLAQCSGQAGTNKAYLDNLCEGLSEAGVSLGQLKALKDQVDRAAASRLGE